MPSVDASRLALVNACELLEKKELLQQTSLDVLLMKL
jgi:hypothetical protein